MIHCIGDSHVLVFSGNDIIPSTPVYYDRLPFFTTHWLGPCTAYNSPKLRERIESIVKDRVSRDDAVLFSFGEIDCRAHLVKHAEEERRPLAHVVEECVQRYGEVLNMMRGRVARVMAWNVCPPGKANGDLPSHGSEGQRYEAVRLFNEALERYCAGKGIVFVSIFERLLNGGGLADQGFMADETHLNQRAIPLIIDEMTRLGVLWNNGKGRKSVTAPVEAVTPKSPIINIVWDELGPEKEGDFQSRGDVTVVWSRLPLKGCSLYAYRGAAAYRGRQEGLQTLLLTDPVLSAPGQFDEKLWHEFDHIVTSYRGLVKGRDNCSPVPTPFIGDPDVIVPKKNGALQKKTNSDRRLKGICFLSSSPRPDISGRMAAREVEIREWFKKRPRIPFHVHDRCLSPFSLLAGYRYSLCLPDTDHPLLSRGYVPRPVLECLASGTLPVVFECPDLDHHLPTEIFIDGGSFDDLARLERFLAELSPKRYARYIKAIDEWVVKGGLRAFSWYAVYDHLVEIYAKAVLVPLDAFFGNRSAWKRGMAEALRDMVFEAVEGEPVWERSELQSAGLPLSRDLDGQAKKDPAAGMEHYRLTLKHQEQGRLSEALEEVKLALSKGASSTEVYYTYAQLLIGSQQYEEAIPILQKVVTMMPWHTHAFNDLGVLFFNKKEHEKAIDYYRTALSADTANYTALRNLLRLLMGLGREQEASEVARAVLASDPSDEQVLQIAQDLKVGLESPNPPVGPPPASSVENPSAPKSEAAAVIVGHSVRPSEKGIFGMSWFREINNALSPAFMSHLAKTFGADVFVETGTFAGETAANGARIFREVHTVELSYELYQRALIRFGTMAHVHVYQGDSARVLPLILRSVKGRAILWLDAHWSGGRTAKATKNTPIEEELEAIKDAAAGDPVFLIDDIRLFPCEDVRGRGHEHYPSLDAVCRAIREINPAYCFAVLGDVLMAYTGDERCVLSPVVEALTRSLLHGPLAISDDEILEAERNIAGAAGEEERAIGVLLETFQGTTPQSAFFHFWRGLTLLGQDSYESARDEFMEAVHGGFTHWRVHLYLAKASLALGDRSAALTALERAIESAPDNREVQGLAGQLGISSRPPGHLHGKQTDEGAYRQFLLDLDRYEKLSMMSTPRFAVNRNEVVACLKDRTAETGFDSHYVYHTSWAARVLAETRPEKHVDIASSLAFATLVSAFLPVEFYDYRPAELKLSNLKTGQADLTRLPFGDGSIASLSCMHVVEHIGLGRYGDTVDPDGDVKAISELRRVLRRGGEILFVVPVGRPKLVFNAHRIYAYRQVLECFPGFELMEFALIPDTSGLIRRASEKMADLQTYGCGCFRLRKEC